MYHHEIMTVPGHRNYERSINEITELYTQSHSISLDLHIQEQPMWRVEVFDEQNKSAYKTIFPHRYVSVLLSTLGLKIMVNGMSKESIG